MHVGSTPPIVGLAGDPTKVGVVLGVRRMGVHRSSEPPMLGVGMGVGGSSVLRQGDVRQRR